MLNSVQTRIVAEGPKIRCRQPLAQFLSLVFGLFLCRPDGDGDGGEDREASRDDQCDAAASFHESRITGSKKMKQKDSGRKMGGRKMGSVLKSQRRGVAEPATKVRG
jgi:hypothetical protein